MLTVIACPECKQNLQVPPDLVGMTVRCPACERTFTAEINHSRSAGAPTDDVPVVDVQPLAEPPPLPADNVPAAAVPEWDKPRQGEPSEELAQPLQEEPDPAEKKRDRKAKSKGTGYYDELMRRQRKRMEPHRGVLVLLLGIFSILCSPLSLIAIGACACGYYAYQMGAHDLGEMQAGRMDPSGRGLSQAGMIMGMIGVVISFPAILGTLCLLSLSLIRAFTGT
jgi:hypothetical protein